jgi:hypothetical protein
MKMAGVEEVVVVVVDMTGVRVMKNTIDKKKTNSSIPLHIS